MMKTEEGIHLNRLNSGVDLDYVEQDLLALLLMSSLFGDVEVLGKLRGVGH